MSTKTKTRNPKKVLPPLSSNLDLNSNVFAPGVDIDSLSGDCKIILELMMGKMDEMKNTLLAKLDERDRKIEMLESQTRSLHSEFTDLKTRLEDVESYQRADSLIFSGDAVAVERENENCSRMVVDLLKDNLNYVIQPDVVLTAYRIGKKSLSQGASRRNVYVKLKDRAEKQSILSNCKSVKPPNLFINENLIPARAKILVVLRRIRREQSSRLSAVGSRDGRIFAWLKPPNPNSAASKIIISSMAEVERLCIDFGLNFSDITKPLPHN